MTVSSFFTTRCSLPRIIFSLSLPCVALLATPAARAQAITASVSLSGAGPLTSLLDDNLDIRRLASDADLTLEKLRRLFAAAPPLIKALLATEGYFLTTIAPSLRQNGDHWLAEFLIDPGAPTRIADVELSFTGAIAQGPRADPDRIARLRRQWSLAPGANFRQAAWDEAKSNVLKGLLTRDFPAAKIVRSAALIDPHTRHAQCALAVL